MKKGWERYASEKRYVQKGYLRKHSDGGSGRKAREASRRDSLQQSRKEQKEVAIETYGKFVQLTEQVVPNEPFGESEALALAIYESALKKSAPILKEKDESLRRDRDTTERSGDDEGCSGSILAMQDIPGKQSKRSGKTTGSKKHNAKPQTKRETK